jgi:hypothetical protein
MRHRTLSFGDLPASLPTCANAREWGPRSLKGIDAEAPVRLRPEVHPPPVDAQYPMTAKKAVQLLLGRATVPNRDLEKSEGHQMARSIA